MRTTLFLLAAVTLGGCALGLPQGPPLVSGHSPADAAASGSEMPQSADSLPVGAEGIGRGPTAREPNYLSYTFTGR